VVIGENKSVGGHHRLPEHPLPGGNVIRVKVGQGLENSQDDDQLADAAGVVVDFPPVLRIAGLVRIGQVEHGDGVAVGLAPQQPENLPAESRVPGGEHQFPPVRQAQVDFFQG
jgi:hypothetical protein